ncbi:hypothetical protein [Desulfobulbus oligotrophicus]|uniref:Uncharacterized protein n=1 Tax=Desulfobulbus oligotrophicus TaxID=1909699 RepID=A0A7T5VDX7_9BACT|nr:hypothetical protein [Desulfobulbus oligotrophicus]QQG66160.1 hypothetical protein HP555_09940 [Desulfobulbus oligotrophicus]
MITPDTHRIFIDDLAQRWHLNIDQIIELAGQGNFPLWIDLTDVFAQKTDTKITETGKKRRTAIKQWYDRIEVSPLPEVLMQISGRSDRIFVTAELLCFDKQGNEVGVTNRLGEEWGENSMIGLKPTTLFATLDDILDIENESNNSRTPDTVEVEHQDKPSLSAADSSQPDRAVEMTTTMPLELQAANICWQTLFGKEQTDAVPVKKAAIIAWLQQQYPELTKAAQERIALMVNPARRTCR